MSKKTIYFKSSNTLINKIRNKSEIITLKKPSFLSKLLNKKYVLICYYTGTLPCSNIYVFGIIMLLR